jgi:hypothetical protein
MTRQALTASLKGWAQDFSATGAVGLFLGLLGPFGSFYNGPAWERVVYWLAMVWTGTLVYGLATRWAFARARSRATTFGLLVGLVIVLAAPFSFISWRLATFLWPLLARLPGLTPTLWYVEGLVITAPFVLVFSLLIERRRRAARALGPAPSPDLLGTTPAEVLCLQMEDHYVRVHTRAGSRLVLATLAQAMEAMGRTRGLQVHRSWWVAEKAVGGAEADGRNLKLRLINGLKAPVARSSVAAVRAAGWLDRPRASGERRLTASPDATS